jgi:hypothetical protein
MWPPQPDSFKRWLGGGLRDRHDVMLDAQRWLGASNRNKTFEEDYESAKARHQRYVNRAGKHWI